MVEYLSNMWNSLFSRSGDIIPNLLAALLILFVGILIASFLRRLVKRLLISSGVDDRFARTRKSNFSFATTLSKLVYYLAMTYVLILVLSKAGITGALEPLQNMLNEFLSYIPNIFGAAIITFAGYMLGKIASEAIGLIAPGVERLSERVGLQGSFDLTNLVKQLVFLFVFIPLLLQALRYLNMDLISQPATEMLGQMLGTIPKILAAAIILGVFYIGGKYVISILKELLINLGIDNLSDKIGVSSIIAGKTTLSNVLGNVAFFFLMFAGVMSAVEKLELAQLSDILRSLFLISGQIFFGVVILLIGNHISQLVSNYVGRSESSGLATIVRYASLGLFVAIALRSMGIANDIVNAAFMLILGAVAVAIALSYGLGGREAAGEHMKEIINKLKK